MKKVLLVFYIVLFVLGAGAQDQQQKKMDTGVIVKKNIEAVGGIEKIKPIKNITLDIPDQRYAQFFTRYYISADGNFKMVSYFGDVATRILTIQKGEVKVNSFLPSGKEVKPIDEVSLKCFAKLFSGAFSLWNFKGDLEFKGLKKYGPKKYYYLKTRQDDHDIEFFLDEEKFFLKRLVFKGSNPEQGRYESAYEFGDAVDMSGFKIPGSWYYTFVGAGPSNTNTRKISNFKTGLEFEKGFFKDREINLGSVSVSKNVLNGNVLVSLTNPRGFILQMINWKEEDLEKSALQSKDKIKIVLPGMEYEGIYIKDGREITPDMMVKEFIILLRRPGDFPLLAFLSKKYIAAHEKFKKLQKITITKISNKNKEGK